MENFVELLKQIEPNKVYGIVKNDNNDILFTRTRQVGHRLNSFCLSFVLFQLPFFYYFA